MTERPDDPQDDTPKVPNERDRAKITQALADLSPWFEDREDFVAVSQALLRVDQGMFDQFVEGLMVRFQADARRCKERRPAKLREPFPVHVLPEAVREFVEVVAHGRCVDVGVPAALSVAAMASAIGLSRMVHDSHADWTEIPVVWLSLVAPSGCRKSPVLMDLFTPHRDVQDERRQVYEHALREYQSALDAWNQRARERRGKKGAEIEPRPEEPALEHVWTSDATVEVVPLMLRSNPRGLLVLQDELAGFFRGMGRYKRGGGEADRSFWLSTFSGAPAKIDRVGKPTVIVRMAATSVVGGIQPEILKGCLDEQTRSSGLAARFLLVRMPVQAKIYRRGPTPAERAEYNGLIRRLFALPLEPFSRADGEPDLRPQRLDLSDEARVRLADFVASWSEESLAALPGLAAVRSKLEAYALRFALILRCVREVTGSAQGADPLSADDLEGGILLVRWFLGEAEAAYAEAGLLRDAPDPERVLRARYELIRAKFDGAVTVREWRQHNTRRTSKQAQAELQALVEAGLAEWRARPSGPRGGAPTQECALIPGV